MHLLISLAMSIITVVAPRACLTGECIMYHDPTDTLTQHSATNGVPTTTHDLRLRIGQEEDNAACEVVQVGTIFVVRAVK